MILLLVNTDTKSRPPIRNVETPVSYTKNSVLRYVSFTNWPHARQTDLKLIVVIEMLTRYVIIIIIIIFIYIAP